MDICHVVLLDIFHKVNGSRKGSGIYYIVTGKKTSQSLSDSQWFGIEHYYAALKGITNTAYTETIEILLNEKWIVSNRDQEYVVTKTGEQVLLKEKERLSFLNNLNGLKYASIESACWHILTLYVQALSNSLYDNVDYSPIVRDHLAVQKVKSLFPRSETERKEKAESLYHEMSRLLLIHAPLSADIFVRKLSGYNRIGNTFEQVARETGISEREAILRFRSVLHAFIQNAAEKKQQYPVFHSLFCSLSDVPALTKSASHTYEMLNKGKTLQEIMEMRNIKASTIEDHLVEFAREISDFSIHPYVNEEEIQSIKKFYNTTKENKLRPFKDAFPHLSYLQIRLVLAKEGGKHATGSSA
ncbi:helix-turn-helix domain-containing protein [Fictibacillus sp. UD]|uniref:helix-turn-helix domain-containing protein n=1 Tax=Fictibacillus sp. UD TaxID=3038777 RepID=UPI0037458598